MSTGLTSLLESVRINATGINSGRGYSSMAIKECEQIEYQQAFAECAFGYGDAIIERADIGRELGDRLQNIIESYGSDEVKVHEAFFGEGGFLDKIIKFIKKIFQKILDFIKKTLGFVFKNPETFKKRWRNIMGLIDQLAGKVFDNDGSKVEIDNVDYNRVAKIISTLIDPTVYTGKKLDVSGADTLDEMLEIYTESLPNDPDGLLNQTTHVNAMPLSLADLIWLLDVSINGARTFAEVNLNNRGGAVNNATPDKNQFGFDNDDWKRFRKLMDKFKDLMAGGDEEVATIALKRLLTKKEVNGHGTDIDEGTTEKTKVFKEDYKTVMALVARIKEITMNLGTQEINHTNAPGVVTNISGALEQFGRDGDSLARVLEKGVSVIDGDIKKLDILSSKLKSMSLDQATEYSATTANTKDANGNVVVNTTATQTDKDEIKKIMNDIGTAGSKIAATMNKIMSAGIDTAASLIVEMTKRAESTLTKISKTFKVRRGQLD